MYAEDTDSHDESMLGYSKHLSVMGILGGIAENIDQILLFHFVGVVELAVYNFAIALPNQMRTPIKNIDAMLQARYVNRTAREITSSIRNKIFWYFLATASVATAYVFIAPYLFKLLFPQYLESVRYSQIYILWILTATFDPINSYISSRKHIKALYASTLAYSLSKIALLCIGAVYWGLLGVIVARVTTQYISVLYTYVLYRKVLAADVARTG
jgi:O-antigen/teichoic acid export membrane protein